MLCSTFGGGRFCFDEEGVQAAAPADSLATIRQEFSRLQTEAQGIIDAAMAANRDLSAEETAANQTRFSRMTTIRDTLSERDKFVSMALKGPTPPANTTVQRQQEPGGKLEFQQSQTSNQFIAVDGETDDQARQRYALHKSALNNYIRNGQTSGPKFTLTTGTGGSVLLPITVGTPIVIKRLANPIRAALAARGLKVIATDSSELINVPVFDDTANAAVGIAQDSTTETVADPAVTGIQLGAALISSGTVWSSNTLLNSLTYDLLGYLQPMLDQRIDRNQAAAWITKIVSTGVVGVTTASTTGVTFNELLNWQHSIAPAYRPYGAFFLSDGLLRAIRGMVDSQGRPLYQESLRDDAPDTLLGWPVFVSTDLATPAANAVSGFAMAVDQAFVRDVNNKRIARYVNIPTRPDQFGICEFTNGDFAFNAVGVRLLKNAAA